MVIELKDNIIYVGDRPFMNYVTGVVMQFTTKNADEVIIKARGKYVGRAVDVAELSVKKFLTDIISVDSVSIDSDEFETDNDRKIRVSSIEIKLKR